MSKNLNLKLQMLNDGRSDDSAPQEQVVARSADQQQRDELWEDLDETVRATRPVESQETNLLVQEVNNYISTPNQKRKGDPIVWWNTEGKSFPKVRKVALKFLTIPGMCDKML